MCFAIFKGMIEEGRRFRTQRSLALFALDPYRTCIDKGVLMTLTGDRRALADRSLRVLEFDKILTWLSSLALTKMGARRCQELRPFVTSAEVDASQKETGEALSVLARSGTCPLSSFTDIRPSLDQAKKGATLPPRALLEIALCLGISSRTKTTLATDHENAPVLHTIASSLSALRPLMDEISGAILGEDEIADAASPELKDIRRHIRLGNDRIKDRLQTMIQSPATSKYLQEPLVTLRHGRYVLPVRMEYRQHIPGLIHDQSSSGATLFIEPAAVVEAGNELRLWQAKEEREIERILRQLSQEVAENAGDLSTNVEILILLDFIFAKALLAQELDAVRPRLNERGRIRLIRARHPLIHRDKVVPCDLWLGDDFLTLVITGPNTGGKTVTLKTVGLLCAMAQAGLHVPCDPGTDLSIFKNIYADIGDEQSIEQSLSTFSSHMSTIVAILDRATAGDLVLLDELGAGTDPAEGAALAQSILNYLLQRDVRTLATTHYSELKAYALSTKGAENASVEFDVETLRPTYRLSIGIPGKSNAFEISRRLGLPEALILTSRGLMDRESVRFEDVIANAEYHLRVAEKERRLAEEAHRETLRIRAEAEALRKETENMRAAAGKKAKEEARKILENTKRECTRIIDELNLLKKTASERGQGTAPVLRDLRTLEDALREGLKPSAPGQRVEAESLKVGDPVLILSLNVKGTVLSKPDAKGDLLVLAGAIRMSVHASQLKLLKEDKAPQRPTVGATGSKGAFVAGLECDVRGLSLDEAIFEVERYLDSVVMAGLHEVSIIHGKGTGTLRSGIQRHLKDYPHVKQVRTGRYGEGEGGVTIVSLD